VSAPPCTPVRSELRDGGNYEGLPLNRCARLRSIAHGGQTVLSNATSSVLGGDLPDLATLEDLGVHRLKDLSVAEHVFQLRHPELLADFPPLRSLDARPNNLPRQLTRFVGRIHELPEVEALLGRTKVLTLTGAGGSGKTRLALQVAADRLDDYPAGVWFVELDRVADPALVPRALATAMKVREQPDRTIVETLVDQLGDGVSMVILDNCEHLIEACAELAAALLAACPQLTLFATSREPLSISGEVAWTVPPLAEAFHLFVDRAVAANPRFALDDATAPAVTTICSRLDGIPLAIELAAARVRTMTAQDISRRLDDGFRLLTTGSRTALARHQTLRATIDWSYDLLSLPEQIVFRRLSVFAGGVTLDAAEQVCAGRRVDGAAVLDLVPLLVSRSLVILQEDPDRGRYRLLEPIREYGYAELRAAEEEVDVRERHLRWCIHVAEEAEPELRTGDQAASLDRLQADLDNFRAAFAWSLGRSDATSALRLASALLEFWIVRADWSEGREWAEHALALPGEVDPALRARALRAAGELADVLSDYPASAASFEESLALARRLGDNRQIAAALMGLANEAERMGRAKDARPLLEEAVALLRGVGDDPSIARSLGGLAWLEDNYPRARSLWANTWRHDANWGTARRSHGPCCRSDGRPKGRGTSRRRETRTRRASRSDARSATNASSRGRSPSSATRRGSRVTSTKPAPCTRRRCRSGERSGTGAVWLTRSVVSVMSPSSRAITAVPTRYSRRASPLLARSVRANWRPARCRVWRRSAERRRDPPTPGLDIETRSPSGWRWITFTASHPASEASVRPRSSMDPSNGRPGCSVPPSR
jgi:predicted ATPase